MTHPSRVPPPITTRALADLARAGLVLTRHKHSEVVYELRHVVDAPGTLFELVGAGRRSAGPTTLGDDGYLETLSVGSHGVGMIVRTAIRQVAHARQARNDEVPRVDDLGVVVTGAAQPNPSFLYASSGAIEGYVSLDDIHAPFHASHGQRVREVAQLVADSAVDKDAPLLLLHAPSQHPYRYAPAGTSPSIDHEVAPAASVAVRFAIAASRLDAADRLHILERIAERCAARGYGFWVTDPRPGHRSGNWFQISRPDPERMALRRRSGLTDPARQPRAVCPMTFVGPARVGSTQAVLDMLALHPPANIVGLSVTSLDDLALIHTQMVVDVQPGDPCRVHGTLGPRCYEASVGTGSESLSTMMACLGIEAVDSARRHDGVSLARSAARSQMDAIAGDYRVTWGPIVPWRPTTGARRAVWASWEYDRSQGGLTVPLDGLRRALARLGLAGEAQPASRALRRVFGRRDWGGPTAGGAPRSWGDHANIEYLMCRYVGERTLRGKAKLSIPEGYLRRAYRGSEMPRAVWLLAGDLDRTWRGILDPDGGSSREMTVSWQEFWLGHWSSTTY